MSAPQWLRRILDYRGIPYQEYPCSPLLSTSPGVRAEEEPSGRMARTVLFSSRQLPVLVVLPAAARVDMARVQEVLGEPDLRPASEEEICQWFKGCHPCAVPPLHLRREQCILMDRSLAHLGEMLLPTGTLDSMVQVRFRDWYRAVRPGVGRFAQPIGADSDGKNHAPVLVVEDESETNQLLCALLEREGLVCEGVLAGRQALDAARQRRPAAILLDLMLPDMTGLEVYQEMCRTGSLRRIPCIVVTALDDEATRQRTLQLGADAFLLKPFQPRELISQVQEVLADSQV